MKSIIEKLGITPIERRYVGNYGEDEGYIPVCRDEDVKALEQQRDELLQLVINFMIAGEESDPEFFTESFKQELAVVQNVTHRGWGEIVSLAETGGDQC